MPTDIDPAPVAAPLIEGEKTFPLAVSNGALFSLRNMVRGGGWAKGTKMNSKGTKLGKILPKLTLPEKEAEREAWSELPAPVVQIPVRFRTTGAACLTAFAESGQLACTEASEELLLAFEVEQ